MRFSRLALLFVILAALLLGALQFAVAADSSKGVLVIQGKALDPAGNPVDGANVIPCLNGRPIVSVSPGSEKEYSTGRNGLFMLEIPVTRRQIKEGKWSVKVSRASFKPSHMIPLTIFEDSVDEKGTQRYVSSVSVALQRLQSTAFWIALIVFLGVYGLIAFDVVHRTLAAFMGASVLLVLTHTVGNYDDSFKILTYDQAIHAVDWNVIFLLMGMMIIVGVLKVSGVFQWLAYKSFQVARGNIFLLASALCIVTATMSAFLDNVTTMLLLTPVTMEIALVVGVSPFVFLVPEILASNFGGTATLIGDPPNIMIGSFAGLTFNDFVINLTPVVIAVMVAQVVYNKLYYGGQYHRARVEDVAQVVSFLNEKYKITDRKILTVGGTVLIGVILLFILHGLFRMEVSVAALFGAVLIILLNKMDIVELLEKEVEWNSLIFFIMLFIVVGAAEQTGILQAVADWILLVCKGNLTAAVLVILWVSGFTSAIVDNIPYTATMLPVVLFLSKTIPGGETGVLWWALSLGACFGGNGTIIGASANVVTTGIAEKAGYKITFYEFMKQAAPITFISLIISSVFLVLRY